MQITAAQKRAIDHYYEDTRRAILYQNNKLTIEVDRLISKP